MSHVVVSSLLAAGEGESTSVLAVPLQELIVGLLAFAIVFGVLAKVALPKVRQTLEDRTEAIEGGIKRAEEAQAEAQRALEEYKAALAQARDEAAAIRAQAQSDRSSIVEEARNEARAAAAAVTAQAEAQLTAERAQATSQLTRQIGDVAVVLAGKIVGESLSDDARVRATVDAFIADLESQAAGEARA